MSETPNNLVLNPQSQLATVETASAVLAAQAKAQIEARYVIAIKNPRDLDIVREKLLKECRRPGFAEVARYKKPIGKGVEGPSIRYAEAALRCMTNILPETITVFDDMERRIVRVAVTDLEANISYSSDVCIEKTVERRKVKDGDLVLRQRTNSHGDKVYIIAATEDDLLNKQNALVSKALRTNGLRLVPGDIVEECMDLVVETVRKKDAADPDAAKRKIFDAFGALGVRVEHLKEYLGHDTEALSPKELTDLRAVYSALKEGETSWREVMDSITPADNIKTATGKEAAPAKTDLKEKIRAKAEAAKAAPQAATQEPSEPGVQVSFGEVGK